MELYQSCCKMVKSKRGRLLYHPERTKRIVIMNESSICFLRVSVLKTEHGAPNSKTD